MQNTTNVKQTVKYIVLYHSPCHDGWCALAIAHMWFKNNGIYLESENTSDANNSHDVHTNPVYIGVAAGKTEGVVAQLINDYKNTATVLAFDLAFTYNSAKMLFNYFTNAHIYDHHKTTGNCMDYPINEPRDEYLKILEHYKTKLHWDELVSGAMLAWKHFYPNFYVNPPYLVQLIQDRDLWTWKLPNSREINAGIIEAMNVIYPYVPKENLTFDQQKMREKTHWLDCWGKFMCNDPPTWVQTAYTIGSKILNTTKRKIKSLSRDGAGYYINDARVYVCNANDLISEIGEYYYNLKVDVGDLKKSYLYDYVVIWRYDHKRNVCLVSMRARQDGPIDVSVIAQKFSYTDINGREIKGGGHRAAAGFEVKNIQILFNWIGNNRMPGEKTLFTTLDNNFDKNLY